MQGRGRRMTGGGGACAALVPSADESVAGWCGDVCVALPSVYNLTGLLPLRPNQIAHRWHIGGITRERQAAEFPATLDRSKQRVVVIGHT